MNTLEYKNFTVKCRKGKGLRLAILAGAVMFAIGCADQDTADNRRGLTGNDPVRSVQQEREDQERARGMFDGSPDRQTVPDRQTAPGVRVPGETIGGTPGAPVGNRQGIERDQMQGQEQDDAGL